MATKSGFPSGIRLDPRNNKHFLARLTDPCTGRRTDRSFLTEAEAIAAVHKVKEARKAYRDRWLTIPPNVENVITWILSNYTSGYYKGTNIVSVEELGNEYIEYRRKMVERGLLTAKSFTCDEYQTKFFIRYCKQVNRVDKKQAFSEDNLDEFNSYVHNHFQSKDSRTHSLRTVRALIDWLLMKKFIVDRPLNIDVFKKVRTTMIDKQRRKEKKKVFTVDEVKKMLSLAPPRLKLYILLALNGGYLSVDISRLQWEMLNEETMRIEKEVRGKTECPQYCELWPETYSLLRSESKSYPNGVILTTKYGTELYHIRNTKKQNGATTMYVTDNIGQWFIKFVNKIGIKGSFKMLRATGASHIMYDYPNPNKRFTNTELYDMWLAHKKPKVDAAYDRGDMTELYLAQKWLRTLYID